MILGAVMTGVIMGPIDGSIVNVVLPSIAAHFQTDYALAQWAPTIYLLAIPRLNAFPRGLHRAFLAGAALALLAACAALLARAETVQ